MMSACISDPLISARYSSSRRSTMAASTRLSDSGTNSIFLFRMTDRSSGRSTRIADHQAGITASGSIRIASASLFITEPMKTRLPDPVLGHSAH